MVCPSYITFNYYDYERGFLNTNPGWYEHSVYTNSVEKQRSIVEWLYENVDNPERHCRWCRFEDKMAVKFRYQRDYIWFSLSF